MIREYLEKKDGVTEYLLKCKSIAENAGTIFLFGSAKGGEKVFHFLQKYRFENKITYVVDNDTMKQGKKFYGIEIISADEMQSKLLKYDAPIIIIASGSAHIIREQLINMGIADNLIFEFVFTNLQTDPTPYTFFMNHINELDRTYDLLSDKRSKDVYLGLVNYKISCDPTYLANIADSEEDQYFDRELIKIRDEECFVDCGAYIGDTLDEFLKRTISFGKYYCFEADKAIYQVLESHVNELEISDVELYNIGCWNRGGYLVFDSKGSGSSRIGGVETGENIKVEALDKVLTEKKVTFVKMDIEGAEQEALYGMKDIIKKQKPILAISIYHSLEDFMEIPKIIHDMNSEYKIYIRHYRKLSDSETVCYAI